MNRCGLCGAEWGIFSGHTCPVLIQNIQEGGQWTTETGADSNARVDTGEIHRAPLLAKIATLEEELREARRVIRERSMVGTRARGEGKGVSKPDQEYVDEVYPILEKRARTDWCYTCGGSHGAERRDAEIARLERELGEARITIASRTLLKNGRYHWWAAELPYVCHEPVSDLALPSVLAAHGVEK